MHIPDGFLDAKTVVATGLLAGIGVATAVEQTRRHLPSRRVPMLGLTAAFVFAAQMINFPVPGGTSGHLVGGVLAAALLGPSGAVLVLTAVLVVQCLLFADGGLLALGANVLNLAVIGGGGGALLYQAVSRLVGGDRGRIVGAVVAGWAVTVLGAVLAAAELALSGVVSWSVVLPAMAGVHMLIGVGEALITALVLVAILRTRPELLDDGDAGGEPWRARELVVLGLTISMALAVFVSPLASVWPDGLEKVSATLGFAGRAVRAPLIPSPAAAYAVPGIASATWATAVAGGVGTVVVFTLAVVLARVLVPGNGPAAPPVPPVRRRP
jgi:cobalt/nickel transport system permease protein